MRFECLENCGRCCRGVSVSQEFFNSHKPNVPYERDERGNYVHKGTHICVWLGKDKKCTIYDDRPQRCIDFATHDKANHLDGYKCAFKRPDGTLRSKDEQMRILEIWMPRLGIMRFIDDEEFKKKEGMFSV